MTGIALVTAQANLDAWVAADLALAQGAQSYTIGTRTYTRANAAEIRNNIKHWQQQLAAASRQGGMRVRYGFKGGL